MRGIGIIFFRVENYTDVIDNEPLMSLRNNHNYKTFLKSPPVSLLHWKHFESFVWELA